MAVTPTAGGTPIASLACGRDAAGVWDRAAAGLDPDEHEGGCPHCTAARADALGLEALVHRMAERDQQDLAPPPSVLDRVLATVTGRFGPPETLALPSPYGPARLAVPAAAAVLRHVVDGMAGLRARSCRIVQPGAGPELDVAITVAARFGVQLTSVTARVRQMVVATGAQALGLPVRRVDIEVVDLWEEA